MFGPTTTFLLRRIAASLDEQPEGFDLPLLDTAAALGLGTKGGRNSPFLRAIERAGTFKVSRAVGPGVLEVRRRIPPLTRSQLTRLSPPLQDEHATWQEHALRTPDLETQRRRARRLALSLAELGEDDEAIETQLHRWKLHPALAHEALRWARGRQQGRPIPPPPPMPATPAPVGAPVAAGRTHVFAPGDAA